MGRSGTYTGETMTQNTIDLAGAMVALAILVAMFTFATLYELKHGKDDDEDSQR